MVLQYRISLCDPPHRRVRIGGGTDEFGAARRCICESRSLEKKVGVPLESGSRIKNPKVTSPPAGLGNTTSLSFSTLFFDVHWRLCIAFGFNYVTTCLINGPTGQVKSYFICPVIRLIRS
jgi:hypothetical protein